jgi:tetratricopeptide (TPR) repeat protein
MSKRHRAQPAQRDLAESGEPRHAELKVLWKKTRIGQFDETIELTADRFRKTVSQRPNILRPTDQLLACCLVCEIYDYYCRYREAAKVVQKPARNCMKDWASGKKGADPWLIERQIQTVLHYADCLYRLNDWDEAELILNQCEERTKSELEQFPCDAVFDVNLRKMAVQDILGRIAFSRGRLARQKGRYELSEEYFGQNVEHGLERLEAASAKFTGDRLFHENAYARLTSAISLSLGLAWMLVHKGQLKAARSLTLTARILFEGTEDRIHKAFCEMLIGTIQRSDAGKDKPLLQKAMSLLRSAKSTFNSFKHARYGAVAAYYLAASHLQSGEFTEAETCAKEVAQLRPGDARWEALSKVLLSRIYREMGESDRAKNFAREARQIVDSGPHVDCKVDAIVALGEAELRGGDRDAAKRSFRDGLELSLSMANPKWTGACYLHLAETYVSAQNKVEAQRYLKLWGSLSPHIQNGFLHSLAKTLEERLVTMKGDFHLDNDLSEKELDWKENKNKLEKFLVRVALDRSGGDIQKAAHLLGVSRPTVYGVLDPAKPKKKRPSA